MTQQEKLLGYVSKIRLQLDAIERQAPSLTVPDLGQAMLEVAAGSAYVAKAFETARKGSKGKRDVAPVDQATFARRHRARVAQLVREGVDYQTAVIQAAGELA